MKKAGQQTDDTFVFCKPDAEERMALRRLAGEIERTLPEVFAPEYGELIAAEKQRLAAELASSER